MAPKIHCLYDALEAASSLKPHPKNRNSHPDAQIDRLAKILEFQGWRYPIKVSKRSGFITSGHGRLLAAKRLKWTKVPVNFQDYESDEQEYADVQADNAIASWSELDLSSINSDLSDLGPDFDLDLLGIENFELVIGDTLEPQCDEDEVPEHVEPKTKLGDIYQLGRHRLMCGDATDPGSWAAIEGDHATTMVFTSPPYGVGDGARIRETYVPGADVPKSLYKSHDDDPNTWPQLMRDWTGLAITHAAVTICNVQMLANNKRALAGWHAEFAPFLVDVAIWDKSHGPPQMAANVLTNAFEYLFILGSREGASRSVPLANFHGNQTNVVRIGGAKNNEFANIHKATMPIELVEWAIQLGQSARHIIDPFGGTGTTMIAAEKHGRSAGLIEMDPTYCDVIVARWEKYTGQTAVLVGAGGGES